MLLKRIKEVIIREEWSIAIRTINSNNLFEKEKKEIPFQIIKNSLRYWCADPFIISVSDKDYIFFEMFDRLKGKGVIGYRVIDKNGKIGKMKVAYESNNHLSFPFVFLYNGEYYMIPESSYDKELVLLRAKRFPDNWERVYSWFNGEKICDSVVLKIMNDYFLFTQPVDIPYTHSKLNLYKLEGNNWKECNCNPIVDDCSRARMAGAIFKKNGIYIRPSQDCESYGDAINFFEIEEISEYKYKERLLKKVTINEISFSNSSNHYRGIHTYNISERYEVIDVKCKETIKFFYLCGYLRKIFKKM